MAVRPIIDDDNLGEEDADSDDLEMKPEWNIGGSEEEIEEMIREADADGDGKVWTDFHA